MKVKNHTHRVTKKVVAAEEAKDGAWKLAYADFVTSMMCFFMLMWLLNTTPTDKLKSMAVYFKPTIGFFTKNGTEEISQSSNKSDNSQISDSQGNSQSELLQNIEVKLNTDFSNDESTRDLTKNISTQMTGDGLEINILDNNNPMFKKGSTELTEDAKAILAKVTKSISYLPNRIVISGHTEKMKSASVEGYTGWDLSAGRASNAMKSMQVYGLPEEKVAKLVAYGDNIPLDSNDPYSPKNRRITITVLSKWSTVDYKSPISKSALSLND